MNLSHRWTIAGALVLVVVLIVGFWLYQRPKAPDDQLIGGQKDAHGCLIGAGYSWCEASKTCIRSWETYCTAAAPKTVVFSCAGGKTITATFYVTDDKFVDLKLSDGRNLSVPHAISASGARYANADESFVFWNKGDTAFVTEGDATTYADCALK